MFQKNVTLIPWLTVVACASLKVQLSGFKIFTFQLLKEALQ